MKVDDAGERIFICSKGEKASMTMTCSGTEFGINHAFSKPVQNSREENDDSGTIEFTVSRDTRLIINFNFSSDSGGKYRCALSDVEDDPDGAFNETVKQFGALPQRRTYTFLIEE